MNTPFWISQRLSLSRGNSRTGVVIAVAGVALAVMVMEFTLAVVVGFKHEIERKLMGFDAQITISAPIQANGSQSAILDDTPYLRRIIAEQIPPGTTTDLAIRQAGILKTDNDFEGVMFLARDAVGNFDFEKANIVEGCWPDFSQDSTRNDIVISTRIASALGLQLGDRVYSTFIIDENVKMRRQTIAGIYRSDFGDYDKSVVYSSMPFMQSVVDMSQTQGNRLEIRGLDNLDDLDDIGQNLQVELLSAASTGQLSGYYPVQTVHQSGAVYFNWLSLLDTNVVVIFILMLAVAGFTLVSSLFILILERVRTIGILRALGADKPAVRRIFVYMTLKVVGLGMIIGNVVGLGLLLIQKRCQVMPLNPEMYYLSSVPVEIQPFAIVLLNIGVTIAAWLILVLPAHMASGIDPAGAVKYE